MPRAFPLEGMPNFRAYAQVNFGGQNAQNWALGHLGISLGIGHGLGINLKKNKTRIPLLDNIYLKETFPQFKLIRGNLKYLCPGNFGHIRAFLGIFALYVQGTINALIWARKACPGQNWACSGTIRQGTGHLVISKQVVEHVIHAFNLVYCSN